MAEFVINLGTNPPDETQSGEKTAYSDWWYYEGVNDPNADTPLTGYYLNRGPKAVMASLRAFAKDVADFLSKPFQTDQIADKAITYEKLDDNVKSMLGGGTDAAASDSYGTDIVADIRAMNSANRFYSY